MKSPHYQIRFLAQKKGDLRNLKRLDQSRQVVVLADSSKAGKVSFASAGGWENVHVLITDKQLDRAFAKELIKQDIKLVRA